MKREHTYGYFMVNTVVMYAFLQSLMMLSVKNKFLFSVMEKKVFRFIDGFFSIIG